MDRCDAYLEVPLDTGESENTCLLVLEVLVDLRECGICQIMVEGHFEQTHTSLVLSPLTSDFFIRGKETPWLSWQNYTPHDQNSR